MRSFPVDAAVNGEFTTPLELDAELREITGAGHDVDNDNLAGARVGLTKVAAGAYGTIQLATVYPGGDLTVHQPGDSAGQVYNIPGGGTGNPWILAPTFADGSVEFSLGVYFRDDALTSTLLAWVGLRLDGELIAQSPIQGPQFYGSSRFVRVQRPVAAGVHLLEPVYGLHETALAAIRTISWLSRDVSCREVAR